MPGLGGGIGFGFQLRNFDNAVIKRCDLLAEGAVVAGLVGQISAQFVVAFVICIFDAKARGEVFEFLARKGWNVVKLARDGARLTDRGHFSF